MNARIVGARVGVCFLLVGCAQPLAPTVQILPPPGKAFADFQADQRVCSIYTNEQVKPMVDSAARATLGAAAIGTVLGAGLGAAIGGGRGAAIAAAGGAVVGTGAGADQGASAGDRIQVFYDNTYAACMVAHGNRLPAPPVQQVIVAPVPYYVQPVPYVVQAAPAVQP
jgi:outer membrane lipoprotein SlyB